MQEDPKRIGVDLSDEPDRTDIRVILGYVRVDRRRTEAELRQTQQHLEMVDRTFRELEQSVAALQRSILKLETAIERLDDRIDEGLWKHTWVVLGGVAVIVGTAAAAVVLFA